MEILLLLSPPKKKIIITTYCVKVVLDISLSLLSLAVFLQVKPLGVIWGKYEQWNKTNTIMFDDLRRNFIMNPQNGLKVSYCSKLLKVRFAQSSQW